jgi:CrcB protein
MDVFGKYLAVAVGGAIGAMARYFLGNSVLSQIAVPFPTATFVINIAGSFIIGFFLTLAAERLPLDSHIRLLIAVGFVGAFTTFSTFEYETARLTEEGYLVQALLNVLLSVIVGFVAVFGGIFAARAIAGKPVLSSQAYEKFERRADLTDAAQQPGAESDIRDSSIECRD